jgi:hypothetical protein
MSQLLGWPLVFEKEKLLRNYAVSIKTAALNT